MTRNGKIARLPQEIREELNRRLENGEQGIRLIEWLNGLAEVVQVLAKDFEGVAISEMNLSQWKNGGFLDWQARQRAESVIERWQAGSSTSNLCPKSDEVAESLTERLMAHYAAALEDAIAETDEKPRKRVERIGQSLRDLVRVRRYELARERERERSENERERVKMERERLELHRARLNKPGAGAEPSKTPGLSHEEKAEIVKQMVRDAKARVQLREEGK